jgi:hypothetical protein
MTSIRQLITDGLREAGIIETGGEPEAEEFEEALRALQRLYSSLFGYELGEQLTSVNFGSNGLTNAYALAQDYSSDILQSYVPANVRLILNLEAEQNLFLHPAPSDGARIAVIDNSGTLSSYNVVLNGNGRKIESADSVTLSTNSLVREWFYRGDLGSWQRVTDLDENDVSPLPAEFDDFLITMLAFRLNPRYGAVTSQEMGEVLSRMRRNFRARYRQTAEVSSEDGIIRLPSNPFSYNYMYFGQGR